MTTKRGLTGASLRSAGVHIPLLGLCGVMANGSTAPGDAPRRIWWAEPLRLCVTERPGGGGTTHLAERRSRELAWLHAHGVRTVISTLNAPSDAAACDRAGLRCHLVPVACAPEGEEALHRIVEIACRALSEGGVAIHGDRWTDFAVAVGAMCLRRELGMEAQASFDRAAAAGLDVTPEARLLLGLSRALPPTPRQRPPVGPRAVAVALSG